MYTAACPGCGADVAFKSAASVLSVCQYCNTTALRTDDGVRDIGKRAALFEDYSPLRIGTAGIYESHAFTLVGRIQMRYEAGGWSEWYVLFDDNTNGWLSDASGQFTMLRNEGPYAQALSFESISPGIPVLYKGTAYYAADVRSAQACGFEGELPFNPNGGWAAKAADLRQTNRFLTLDYSDGAQPEAYEGRAVVLSELSLQLLRDDDTITRTSGRMKAPLAKVPCPNCGSSLTYVEGVAAFMQCGSCGSQITASAGTTAVLVKAAVMHAPPLTLQPGDTGTLSGIKWTVLGAMTRKEVEVEGEGETWTEYLLHNPSKGFTWLIETADGWHSSDVLNVWPSMPDDETVVLQGTKLSFQYDYKAVVTFVVGAFNWRPQVGDVTAVRSYKSGGLTLDGEASPSELTWSKSIDIPTEDVLKAFGRVSNPEASVASAIDESEANQKFLTWSQITATVVLSAVLIFALITGHSIIAPIVGLALTWLPFAHSGLRDFLEI